MKKIAIATILSGIAFAISAFIAPAESVKLPGMGFEGVVTYTMTVDNTELLPMFKNCSMTTYLKGSKSKSVWNTPQMVRTEINDTNSVEKPIVLIEMKGNKFRLKYTDSSKISQLAPIIKYVEGTKEIAGYKCKKAKMTITIKVIDSVTTSTFDVYYTDEIPNYDGKKGQFSGLKGFPLEYSIGDGAFTMNVIATEVKPQSVTDDTFIVPAGFESCSLD